ncbi:MAG: hypothetical protein WC701_01560 [Kiritimatiellales bacterium]
MHKTKFCSFNNTVRLEDMRREAFHSQLLAATFSALRFGQDYVKNRLPLNVRYIAVLNQSYDNNRKPDELVYPEDEGRIESDLTDTAVVDLLHRDDRCPQWIDIAVAGADKNTTLLRLLCCGRYHGDESRMYYYESGLQPFGIKSPDLPVGWEEGITFRVPEPNKALHLIEKSAEFSKGQG